MICFLTNHAPLWGCKKKRIFFLTQIEPHLQCCSTHSVTERSAKIWLSSVRNRTTFGLSLSLELFDRGHAAAQHKSGRFRLFCCVGARILLVLPRICTCAYTSGNCLTWHAAAIAGYKWSVELRLCCLRMPGVAQRSLSSWMQRTRRDSLN